VADERLARAAWSRLVEPGDPVAGPVLDHLGVRGLLQLVLSAEPVPEGLVTSPRARALVSSGLERWRVRVATVDPERDVRTTERLGGRLLVPGDAEWPAGLDDLGHAAPACLWVRGSADLARAGARSLALVGARASTPYGDRTAAELAAGVADRGISVVSGGAYGIDAAAHEGALAAGGTTVAVLACGVDRVYPSGNEGLMTRVGEAGAVVTEVAPGSAPTRHRFLQRNRLIAALAGATVVVEAAWRSGALSTASHAAGLLRPVGAVPGPVTSAASAGCHRLLREAAATCITDAAEAAELVEPVGTALPGPRGVPEADHDGLPPHDLRVLDALPVRTARSTLSLAQVAGLPELQVLAALGRLSLLGLAESPGGGTWRRARRAGAAGRGA
jgi:DNA processing protein